MQLSSLLLLLPLAACGSSPPATVDAIAADATAAPSLAVAATPATVARGETVTIAVTVMNFKLVNPTTGPAPKPGEGHFHYYIDDATDYVAGWTQTVTFRPGPATALGAHQFRFVLANSAHEEVTPTVEATAMFTVQ